MLQKPLKKNNTLRLKQKAFPVGSDVLHKKYGICRIVSANGMLRHISARVATATNIKIDVKNVSIDELSLVSNL